MIWRTFTHYSLILAAFAGVFAFVFTASAQTVERRLPQSNAEIRLSFAPIVKTASPAVVNVYAAKVVQERRNSLFNDPLFQQFFGRNHPFGGSRERVRNSLGSGVIVDPDGIVVTNHHVIKDAETVTVVLADKREYEAAVMLSDPDTDLAVLRIKADDGPYPYLSYGAADQIEVGDLVLAIGNPFGVGQTVTSGIVSATARTKVGVSDYQFFIQTDAPINPGNSGGALIDMTGSLIGINTAIFTRSGGSNGIGFAIPTDMVQLVVESARTGTRVRRPWLGANLQAVDKSLADSLGLDRPTGALVSQIFSRSPADQAGLRPGDVITQVAGQDVDDPRSFGYRFSLAGTSGNTELTVIRDGRTYRTSVALKVPPEDPPRDERFLTGPSPLAGATVWNVSPAVSAELQLDSAEEGVVVHSISRQSPAARMGLKPGDIVLQINGQRIGSTNELQILTEQRASTWRMEIKRGERILETAIRG